MKDFVTSSWMTDEHRAILRENYLKNRKKVVPCEKNSMNGKVGILVGASPAIKANYEYLKGLDDNFVIVCSPTTLKFLLEQDIKPHYVMAVEGRDHWIDDFDCDTSGLHLIASPFVLPEALDKWQGELSFYMLPGSPDYNQEFKEDWEGRFDYEISGGNAISTAFCWAYKWLDLRDFIFMGMSLCFYDEYYHDGHKKADENVEKWRGKYQAVDMYGKLVPTTPVLTMYKVWLEAALQIAQGNFFNCTEDGILGVWPEINNGGFTPKYIPWMGIMPLKLALTAYKQKFMEGKENGLG